MTGELLRPAHAAADSGKGIKLGRRSRSTLLLRGQTWRLPRFQHDLKCIVADLTGAGVSRGDTTPRFLDLTAVMALGWIATFEAPTGIARRSASQAEVALEHPCLTSRIPDDGDHSFQMMVITVPRIVIMRRRVRLPRWRYGGAGGPQITAQFR
jgi:hypothetical protein